VLASVASTTSKAVSAANQWRRIAQTNKLSRHEGRDRRSRQPRTTGQH
jgi:hypothetical protein